MISHQAPNGHWPHTNGFSQGQKLRVPTVNEALPFSPFSSIVPFNPGETSSSLLHPKLHSTIISRDEF